MIQRKPKAVYVNPQQLQRQREHRDEVRKSIVPNPDPAHALAKAWRIGKLATSPAASGYTEGKIDRHYSSRPVGIGAAEPDTFTPLL